MDQGTLVGDQIVDGRRFIERFAADGHPIRAAFWARDPEGDRARLHVVTELIDRLGLRDTYETLSQSLDKLDDPYLDIRDLLPISPNHPVAKDVLATMADQAGRSRPRALSNRLGGIDYDFVYIYPCRYFSFAQGSPMTTEEIGREVMRLMNRAPGPFLPSRVTMKDGDSFEGIPFAIELGDRGVLMVRFHADGEASLRVVRMDEIASIV